MERYTVIYPHGQPGLPDDPVTAYVNELRATHASPGSATYRRAQSTRVRAPTRDCCICVASTSSSSTDPEPTPHHRATDTQRMVRLDELPKSRCQLDEELANLHQELGENGGPHNPPPAPRQVPVQEQRREGNG
jgi:hypothetical protein